MPRSLACSHSLRSQTSTVLRTAIYMDATWLYYGMVLGRQSCPVQAKIGVDWNKVKRVDYLKLTQVIRNQLQLELNSLGMNDKLLRIDNIFAYIENTAYQPTRFENYRSQMIKDLQDICTEVYVRDSKDISKYLEVQLLTDMMYHGSCDQFDVLNSFFRTSHFIRCRSSV